MAIQVVKVESSSQMDEFVNFSLNLYKDCPYYVPELAMDTRSTLSPDKNPAFEFSTAQLFLAMKDGSVAGRVAGLVNSRANETWGHQTVRFGWIDFIEDYDVCKALLDAVSEWGKEQGMNRLEGPMGFTDFDREGALTMGYDRIATMATIYNYPYYIEYYERYGLVKAAEWLEYLITVPEELPENYVRLSKVIAERYGLTTRIYKNTAQIKKHGAYEIFSLLNECYAPLYGFSKLSDRQINKYVNDYIPFADLELLPMIYDAQGNLVGTGLMVPSIAKALQKCRGKLFPFGWIHLLKVLKSKKNDTIEFLLVAVKPEYQGKGVNALMMTYLLPVFQKKGFKYCETNCELEDNFKMNNLWKNFPHENHKRRRVFEKDL